MKILLMGNPNVGKSVFFSRLTGANASVSNYAGTTVEYRKGQMRLGNKTAEVIDVPGTYSLKPTSKAEEVAVEMLQQGDMIINVVNATNLERNLNLTFQLMERKKPMVIALNMWDEAGHVGVEINIRKLEKILGVPVVPTVAVTGVGIKKLVETIPCARVPKQKKLTETQRWSKVGKITGNVQKIRRKHHTPLERLGDLSIKPASGLLIAAFIMAVAFSVIRFIGEGLIRYLLDPMFNLYAILLMKLSGILGSGFLHDIIIGKLINGQIAYTESMGLLSTGLYVPIAMVLPYVIAFYTVLSIMEDSGYLPRLAVLVDNVMHKIGLHGYAIIPMMLGLGCNVPGALATRVLENRREKFIAATLMAIAVPCAAQLAMIMGLVGPYGIKGLGAVFLTLALAWAVLGVILNKMMNGKSPEIFFEIPPYRIPQWKMFSRKVFFRVKGFVKEAVPYVLLGVFIVNLLYVSGIIDFVGRLAAPVIVSVMGLPEATVGALIVGFLRKDVAVGMLLPLGLSLKQLIIASVVLTMYFPCVATFSVLVKELGIKDTVKSAGIMIATTIIVGGLLNLVLWF